MHHKWFRASAIAVAYVASLAVYSRLPAQVPDDWWIPGESDLSVVRSLLAFFLPTASVAIVLLFRRVASIDPLRENYERFRATFELVLTSSVLFALALHAVLLATLLGAPSWTGKLPALMFGLILIVVGNVVPRIKPNVALGIRTPWTLRDDRIWARTHRAAGYLLVACGLAVLVAAAALPAWLPRTLEAGAGIAIVGLVAFSYVLWRAKKRTGASAG